MKSTCFTYSTVEDGEIRLLRLLPGSGSEPLEGILETMPIRDASRMRPYEALSYVWGDASQYYDISLSTSLLGDDVSEGLPLQVQSNLRDALLHLRLKHASRLLWIDAICIDQDNVPERSQQVQQMGYIYLSAGCVIIWLGNEDHQTAEALRFVEMARPWGRALPLSFRPVSLSLNESSHWSVELETPGEVPPQLWDAFSALLDRAWFKRGWIFQEAVLARKAVLRIGSWTLPWACLVEACDACQVLDMFVGGQFETLAMEVANHPYSCVREIAKTRKAVANYRSSSEETTPETRARLSLEGLLCSRRRDLVTDPRDKVFCLDFLVWPREDRVAPDYTLTTAQVYTDTAMMLARLHPETGAIQSLKFLSWLHGTGRPNTPNLPSWAPDWSVAPNTTPLSNPNHLPLFDASKGTEPTAHFIPLDDVSTGPESIGLRARGVRLLTIQALGSVFTEISFTGGPHAVEHAKMLDQFPDTYPTSTLHYASPHDHEPGAYTIAMNPLGNETFRGDSTFWSHILAFERGTVNMTAPAGRAPYKFLSEYNATQFPMLRTVGRQFPNIGRRFFVSTAGFMGLAPEGAEVGDEVCVLFGANVPYVIRKVEGSSRYVVVGECSVAGLMYGEAMQDIPPDRTEDLVFV